MLDSPSPGSSMNPSPSPAVSVLLPVYNAASYVGLSIESILTQTFQQL
jgi:hypothetical protein